MPTFPFEKTLSILFLLFAGFLLTPSLLLADDYEVSVTQTGNNLYEIDGHGLLVQTQFCHEQVNFESAVLQMDGYSGELLFADSGTQCDVKAVFAPSGQASGRYSVTVNRDDEDWYEVWGQGAYIRTYACPSLALGADAILALGVDGQGRLYFANDECRVEGLYSKISL